MTDHSVDPDDLIHGIEDAAGPLIRVIGQLTFPGMSRLSQQLATTQSANSFAAIRAAGGRPRLVASSAAELPGIDEVLDGADGLLFLGGSDVDLSCYDHTGPAPRGYAGADKRADEFSIALLRAAAARDLPTLAFCKGSQLMNVAFGGTLIGDIEDWAMHRGAGLPGLMIEEPVTLEAGSLIAHALGRTEAVVINGHHQAVDRVADALRAVARAADGMVEAVEHRGASFMVGVQWHPDDALADLDDRRRIFDALIARARPID
ncbi:MAG: gamma-glutamyl-gamma-aminobutyrate hydrolase family protein [Actinobacteria bacterium]|nr:gamma-glutamyl-gamma-aminobutyrate hydrolase family protein [Actinomycetota bacterium]